MTKVIENNKAIDMNKKYKTRSGLPVRIVCVDRKDEEMNVVGLIGVDADCELILTWDKNGSFLNSKNLDEYDLIEISPYEDFKVDDLCVVKDYCGNHFFRYFAKEMEGIAYCFQNGKTSVTGCNELLTQWPTCRKATPEEIATKTIKED